MGSCIEIIKTFWNQFFTWQIMYQWFMFYSISLQQDTVRDLPEALN